MPKDVRIWEVHAEDRLAELKPARLDLEERIETWLEQDISIIADEVLVIGRQVGTGFGGAIDLLCLDSNGDTVIVELKRDKTPRDITAQVLDYASWVQDLSSERIIELADQYLRDRGPLQDAFEQRFGEQLPETLNGQHRMLVVASELDPSTERILNYLSGSYGVDINAVTFRYFRQRDRREFLARVFLIEPSQVAYSARTKSTSKRRRNLSYEELQEIAEDKGVGELYSLLFEELTAFFDTRQATQSSVAFIGDMDEGRRTIFSLRPPTSGPELGLHFEVYTERLARFLGTDKERVLAMLPPDNEYEEIGEGMLTRAAGYFRTEEDVTRFVSSLRVSQTAGRVEAGEQQEGEHDVTLR